MTLYFFHVLDGTELLIDEDGLDLPNLESAKHKALTMARDTLSNDIKDGKVDLGLSIEVEDVIGNTLHSLPLEQAFAMSQRL